MKMNSLRNSVLALALLFSVAANGDVITDWNSAALQMFRENRTTPPAASRALAMMHVAMYDAVNGITRTHQPYYVPSSVPASASVQAAASAAANKVLTSLFPTNAAVFNALHASILNTVRNGPQKTSGANWGQSVGEKILALRANDGSTAVVTPLPAVNLGDWVPTPPANAPYLLPQWGHLTCFGLTSPSQFRPPGPPALTSDRYTQDYNEVKALGRATGSSRTPEQTQIAQFWADGAGTETPPGHWNHIAQDVAAAQGNTLTENASLFALLNIAMADAAIVAWDAKYTFHNWRPVTAIRNGDADGNPLTAGDPAWSSLIGTPPFPDYVSGHSTFSAAAAVVLAAFYGTDDIAFTTGSDFLPTVERSFTSFSAAAEEAAMSRVYGGIHFRFASDDGLAAGTEVGNWTISNFLLAKGNRSRK